jgi:hypothetical protein
MKQLMREDKTHTINIRDYSCNTRKACTTTRYDTHILVGVLACFALAISVIVQVRNGFTKNYLGVKKSVEINTKEGKPFTPVVGAYSNESRGKGQEVGLGRALGIWPTSGAPCPRLLHSCEEA